MWGDLIGSDAGGVRLHSFRYHGVPDTYRIILVTKSGESWVFRKYAAPRNAAIERNGGLGEKDRQRAQSGHGLCAAILCTLLPTLLIEGLLLFAFGYRSRRSLLVFLLVNLVTQGGFAVYLAVTVLNHGVSGWSLIFYIPIELIIMLVELLLYRRLLTEKNKGGRRVCHRRKCTARDGGVGSLLIDPLWRFIVHFSNYFKNERNFPHGN